MALPAPWRCRHCPATGWRYYCKVGEEKSPASATRPVGVSKWVSGQHAAVRDGSGSLWWVKLESVDAEHGWWECVVLDAARSRANFFEVDFFPAEPGAVRRAAASLTQGMQLFVGISYWLGGILQDLPRAMAETYVQGLRA